MKPLRSSSSSRPGFTLVEASIATLIVAVMVSAAISVVGIAARGTLREREWRRSQSLASSLMGEVLSTSFTDPQGGSTFGIEAGETAQDRSTYDDVDDFDGYAESSIVDTLGNKLTWANGWTRAVTVENVAIDNPSKVESDSTHTGLRQVIVSVTSPALETRTMVALKAREGVIDSFTPRTGENRVTGVRVSLSVGSNGSVLVGGTSLFNAPLTTAAAAPAAPADPK